jgi:hypothetical protein
MRAILVAIVVLVGLGVYLNWSQPAANMADDTPGRERSQSLAGVQQRAGARESGKETALGWVKKVDATEHCFRMTTVDNEKLTVGTDHATRFRLNDREITLADLEIGDQVRVAYDIINGKIAATAITVDRR